MTIREAADEAMRDTEMNDWVGGGHPALVGSFSGDVLQRLSTIGPRSRVVDFGCGIGRVPGSFCRANSPRADIWPSTSSRRPWFLSRGIQPRFAGTAFEFANSGNEHFDRHIDEQHVDQSNGARHTEALTAQYCDRFTHAFAFSMFTHLYAKKFVAAGQTEYPSAAMISATRGASWSAIPQIRSRSIVPSPMNGL